MMPNSQSKTAIEMRRNAPELSATRNSNVTSATAVIETVRKSGMYVASDTAAKSWVVLWFDTKFGKYTLNA